jgi:butyrate kinase
VVAAFIHQVIKNIGAYSAVGGRPDVIALTGGVARWSSLMDRIDERISWIAPVVIFPGELELEALAEGAGRVLLGLEEAKVWRKPY